MSPSSATDIEATCRDEYQVLVATRSVFFTDSLAPYLAMIDLCPVSVWHRRTLHRMERDTEGINHSSLA